MSEKSSESYHVLNTGYSVGNSSLKLDLHIIDGKLLNAFESLEIIKRDIWRTMTGVQFLSFVYTVH